MRDRKRQKGLLKMGCSGLLQLMIELRRYRSICLSIGGSSNGRTAGSGPAYWGSNPCPPAMKFGQHPCGDEQILLNGQGMRMAQARR